MSGGAAAGRGVCAWMLLCGLSVLAACQPVDRDGRDVPAEPTPGGTVVVGARTDFGGFNPITNTDIVTVEVINFALFTPLIRYDEELGVEPYLAESWQLEGDTAVVFELRQDLFWHDGEPVTADDVVFTFELAKDPATASLLASAFLSEVERAEAQGPYTVRFDFSEPFAQALESFWWPPVPRHLLEGVDPSELRVAPFNRNPVGSGPYRFVEWLANDRLVVERNPEFPAALGGPPLPDRVFFRIIPEAPTMLTELLTGGVHVDLPVIPEQAREIEARADLELFAFPGRTFYYLGWNNERAPFDDTRVRRAMTLALDRQEIIDALLAGYGTLATSPIPPWSPLDPGVEPLPHDPDAAAALLEEAGWVDQGDDGVRRNADGEALRFTLLTSDAPLNRSVVEVAQAQLRRVGVEARIQVLEFQTLLTMHRGRDFDAVFTTWVLDNFQIASAPNALFHSRWADVPGSANRSSVADSRLDALIDRGSAATDDEEAREIWQAFTEVLQEEQPVTFMFWLDELAASRAQLQGVTMDPRGELVSIAEWWLPRGR